MRFSSRIPAALAVFVLLACQSSSSSSETPRSEQHKSDPPQRESGQPGAQFSVAGVEFTAPEGWVPIPPTGTMRKASFEFGPVGSDTEKAELHVFFFGPDQGGGVESNIERWLGQVTMAEGASTERESFTSSGYPVHTVAASGSYALSMGGPMTGQTEQKEGWRLLGAIVEGAQGNIFFRAAGPEATVKAMEPGLKTMLEGLVKTRE